MKISEQELLKRYSYYYDNLRHIGSLGIMFTVKFKHLNLSKGKVEKAYNEIKFDGFKGTIVDYLQWISSNWILYMLNIERELRESIKTINEKDRRVGKVDKRIKQIIIKYKEDAINFSKYYVNNERELNNLINEYGFSYEEKISKKLITYITEIILDAEKRDILFPEINLAEIKVENKKHIKIEYTEIKVENEEYNEELDISKKVV